MSNQLITTSEAAQSLLAVLDAMPASEAELAIYWLQTKLGSFPRDLKYEKQMLARIKAEKR